MNRWIARIVTLASLAGAAAVVPAGIAFAQTPGDAAAPGHHHGHHQGLIGAALQLDSLTPAQRTSIEQLAQARKTAEAPVRAADAQVLTVLAQQVEQASIDKSALAPSVSARESAALTAHTTELANVQKLHDLLTSAQRGQLIDAIEAHAPAPGSFKGGQGGHGRLGMIAQKLGITDQQKSQILANLRAARGADAGAHAHGQPGEFHAWLESFRGDSFTASASGDMQQRMEGRADHMEDLLAAAVPVLTPAQRSQLATHLRARAAHETHS